MNERIKILTEKTVKGEMWVEPVKTENGKKIMTDEKRNEIENRINKIHRTAREKARKILQNCFSDTARIEARKIMNDAFNENWKIISQYVK